MGVISATISLDLASIYSGQTTHAMVNVSNSGLLPLVILSGQFTLIDAFNPKNRVACNTPQLPVSPWTNPVVPAGGSLLVGPVSITAYSNAVGTGAGQNGIVFDTQVNVGCELRMSDRSYVYADVANFNITPAVPI